MTREATDSSPENEDSSEQEQAVLRGSVERVTFHNPENGYTVLKVKVPDEQELVPVVGTSHGVHNGAEIVARGRFTTHPKFGRQFSALSVVPVQPSSAEGLTRYLASGLVKGIGPKTAARIVRHFGGDTLEVIYQEPERLHEVPGLGHQKARMLAKAFQEQKAVKEVMRFLIENDISPLLAKRIHQRFGEKSVEVLRTDPYVLARELKGVGFVTADRIALGMGIEIDSIQRLKAGLFYALEKGRDDGHCYLPGETLCKKALVLLSVGEEVDLTPALEDLIAEGLVTVEENRYYLKQIDAAEQFVARFVSDRTLPLEKPRIGRLKVESALKKAGQELEISFSEEQRKAVVAATEFPLLLITGGPGCGKTTVTRALVKTFLIAKKRVALCAPTGRAAQRMSQVCHHPASTIHRLLRFDPFSGRFLHGPSTPLEIESEPVDLVVVDEASMVDIQLGKALLSAIPHSATLVLVGDKDQLPSVGPGRMFADLLSLHEVQSVNLSQLFRRSSTSTINDVAFQINAGITPDIPEPDGATKADAYFLERRDAESAAGLVESLVADQIPRKFGIPPRDITVLTPTHRGPLGTQALNERIQNALNPSSPETPYLEVAGQPLRLNDRVCQRVNNYQLDDFGVFNGDVGSIHSVNQKDESLQVELWDGRLITYESGVLSQLALAYAITVHRSQGSEIPCVILALHDSHYTLLERQLIYTGVTRSKQLLIVVGSKKALALASKRSMASKRCTRLAERVREQVGSHTAAERELPLTSL